MIDRGATQGVVAGSPVINEAGVLGQRRVYPLSSEVTLLSDREAAIPCSTSAPRCAMPPRAGPTAGMELRFLAANADIKVGDVMTTSGLDGIYPPGLPVAVVAAVERRGDSSFAQVQLAPLANADAARHVLVLQPLDRAQAARKAADAAAADGQRRAAAAKVSARQSAKG